MRWLIIMALNVFLLFASSLFVVAPQDASAQELVPMSEWLALPEDEQEPSYALVRCAGLHAGLLFYLGDGAEASLGADLLAAYKDATDDLLRLAAIVRAEQANLSWDSETVASSVLNDAFAIAEIYEERLRASYRTSGSAITSDTMVVEDLVLCGALAQTASETLDTSP